MSQRNYQQTRILTASPERLRLMLIEGAMRFAQQTLNHWEEGRDEEAFESLVRCRDIVTELMTCLNPEASELNRQIFSIYMFLFARLTEAQAEHSSEKIKEVLGVLEIERETWKTVCENAPAQKAPHSKPPLFSNSSATDAAFSCDA